MTGCKEKEPLSIRENVRSQAQLEVVSKILGGLISEFGVKQGYSNFVEHMRTSRNLINNGQFILEDELHPHDAQTTKQDDTMSKKTPIFINGDEFIATKEELTHNEVIRIHRPELAIQDRTGFQIAYFSNRWSFLEPGESVELIPGMTFKVAMKEHLIEYSDLGYFPHLTPLGHKEY